jgi:RHS repeat-associated protein
LCSTYDSRGRLTRVSTDTRQAALAYDANGNLAALTDSLGRQTRYEYDAVGRVTGVSRPDGSFVNFAHDANGNLTVLVNPSKVAHKFAYNKVNRASSYTTPLSGSYQYRYDRDRRPTEMLLPSGRIIRNIYDKGRLVRTETPEGEVYLDYLCGSKIGSITKSGEGIGYTYDGSLLTSETTSGSLNQAVTYSYNNDFARVQATYAGQTTNYGYDNDGLLTQAGAYAITRDAGNGLPVAVSGAGLQLNRGFNGHGEVDSQAVAVSGKVVGSWSLARDNAGRIVRKTEAAGGPAASYDYVYDANGRLLRVLKDGVPVEEYAYDENGTRVFEMNTLRGIAGRSYQYSDEDHLLKAGEWTYQYDPDGFLTAKINSTAPADRTLYSYSARGELLTVILPDSKRIDYVCDPLGRRIAKKVNGVVVEKYHWQGLTRLLAVYDGANILRQRFEYADDRMPMAMTAFGQRYFLTYDQVGSLIAVADSSGAVVESIQYDSFGNILEDTNPSFTIPFGFAGGLLDRDTGLVRFGYRDYDPELGRWTAKDPIGFDGGDTDLYGYVLNDPVNFVDPIGEFVNLGAAGVGAAIGAAVGATNALFNHGDVLKGALSGAVVGSLAGLTFGTSIISNSLIGAGIGAISDIASQRYSNPCGNINGTSVAISALSGAFGAGAGTAMLKGGATAVDAALFSGALSGGTSMGLNYVDSSELNMVPYK